MSEPHRWPAPWIFSVLILPLGIIVGFKSTPLPFLLAQAGVSVERIATVSSIVILPGILVFLWAPLVDTKLRRRTWLAIAILATAASVCIYFPLIGASHVSLMTGLILAGGVADSLILAACGGLMVKTLSTVDQPKGAAWNQAGYLGGGALGGAAVLWLAARLPLFIVGFLVGAFIATTALVAFTIREPPPLPSAGFRHRLGVIGSEIWTVIRVPERRWSGLLLVSPLGAGAAQPLLPAIAWHYGVGASGVMWTNGIAGGLVLAFGSLCGALVPGDWDRRLTYAGAGLTNALAALVFLAAHGPLGYLIGTGLYLATEGFCWARFTALLVQIVGKEASDASTLFSFLNAAGTIPIIYMVRLDGVGFHMFGTHGLLWTDASANLLVFVIVVAVFLSRGMGFRIHTPSDSR